MKKLMPENPEYWIKQGMSSELAIVESERRRGGRYGGHKNYYLLRNLAQTEQEAIQLAEEWKDKKCTLKRNTAIANRFGGDAEAYKTWKLEKCNLSKKNLLKIMSEAEYIKHKHDLGMNLIGNGPMYIQYWVNQGYNENEAKQKIKQIARKHSKRCIEHWIVAGYSLEESISQVSMYQTNVSVDKFIQRYGKDIGKLKYEEYCYLRRLGSIRSYLYWVGLGYTEDDAKRKVSEIQSGYSKLQPKCIGFWMKRGYEEAEALILSKQFAKKMTVWSVDYWLDKGLAIDDAKLMVTNIQRENSRKGLLSYKRSNGINRSQLEERVIKKLVECGFDIETDYVVNDFTYKKVYFPDIVLNDYNAIIEIYGDYWHGNSNIYEGDAKFLNITYQDKWIADSERVARLETLTGKKVVIWWESDILNHGIDNLIKKLEK